MWIGVRRPLIILITIGRPQQQLRAVQVMAPHPFAASVHFARARALTRRQVLRKAEAPSEVTVRSAKFETGTFVRERGPSPSCACHGPGFRQIPGPWRSWIMRFLALVL